MRKKFVFISIVLLAAVFLSGCTGAVAWPGLSASGDVAYLANTNTVYAVDAKSGKQLWKFSGESSGGIFSFGKSPNMYITNPVVTDDGLVIVLDSSSKHVMYALDPNDIDLEKQTPAIKWKFSAVKGLWIAPPLAIGDRLFAPNSDGKVYVLDLTDGKSEKQAIEAITVSESAKEEARLWAQPVTDGERIFVTSLDKSVIAIDLETYEILWHEDLGGAVPGGAALGADGMLYVGSLAKQLERFDPVTGAHEPVLDTKGWIWGTPVASGDTLYFGDVEGYVYSFNTASGALNWEAQPDSAITASPLVYGDQILVATESGGVFAFNAEGDFEEWYKPTDKGKAYTTPVVAGDFVLVAYLESDYYLVALDAESDEKWTFSGK